MGAELQIENYRLQMRLLLVPNTPGQGFYVKGEDKHCPPSQLARQAGARWFSTLCLFVGLLLPWRIQAAPWIARLAELLCWTGHRCSLRSGYGHPRGCPPFWSTFLDLAAWMRSKPKAGNLADTAVRL